MARRRELQGICNDMRDTFVSRYNRIDGYWALGLIQSHLLASNSTSLEFDLIEDKPGDAQDHFRATATYYRTALLRLLRSKSMPHEWVTGGAMKLTSLAADRLECRVQLTTDNGTTYESSSLVRARRHNPRIEYRSAGNQGPTNQQGI